MLSLDLLDSEEEILRSARRMAVAYTAIAAFENSARDLIKKVLLEEIRQELVVGGDYAKSWKNAETKMHG